MPDNQDLSPMMQVYMKTKETVPDCFLFFRLGDFYEMFFEDAIAVSKELGLTLTGRNCGTAERAPMCGVPYRNVDSYISRLTAKGYKVAVCEQMEDPRKAVGMVKREITRIITPGTNTYTENLDAKVQEYLMCIVSVRKIFGIALVDITTGEFLVTQIDSLRGLYDEMAKMQPREILCADNVKSLDGMIEHAYKLGITLSDLQQSYLDSEAAKSLVTRHFGVSSLNALGIDGMPAGVLAGGALLQFLKDTQKISMTHITKLQPYASGDFMLLDASTRRNLELTETIRDKRQVGSLIWVLDKTKTAMGGRLLRTMIEQPLINRDAIEERLDGVQSFRDHQAICDSVRELLNDMYDLERLIGRVSYRTATPRDLLAMRNSLAVLPDVVKLLNGLNEGTIELSVSEIDCMEDVCQLLVLSLNEDAPIAVREGGIIREGYDEEVDRLRAAGHDGKTWLAQLEAAEREKTGIKTLRIKYSRSVGYFYEVNNSYASLVPDDYIRKQTLTNAERYTNAELKRIEDEITGADERLSTREYELFCKIRDKVEEEIVRMQRTAKAVARIDVLASLAVVAEQYNYVRPRFNNDTAIDIREGRHPVVERMLDADSYIPNDTYLDEDNHRVAIITGPNMAGKSTYMRQVALIVLMAQMGSFVPAASANIGLVDRIFTRVGASDDLASGESTFMVEMNEVSNILRNATRNSLLILDEIGRGTSTYDGLSIAWAVIEHICDRRKIGARTLFATHYHELTQLEGKLSGVDNYHVAVLENADGIVFLRKIMRGSAGRSYGIEVAKLAGLPQTVIDRAQDILRKLLSERKGQYEQLSLGDMLNGRD